MYNRWKCEKTSFSISNQLGDAPVLKGPVWEVSPDDEGNFSLGQLLDSDLERVRLAVQWNKDGGVHAVAGENILQMVSERTYLICRARVPRIRALSYFVKYRVVMRTLFG